MDKKTWLQVRRLLLSIIAVIDKSYNNPAMIEVDIQDTDTIS